MNLKSSIVVFKLSLLFILSSHLLTGQQPINDFPLYSNDVIKSETYKIRRQKVLEKMDPNSIAVFKSNDEKIRNGDVDYQYRQNSTFYYLTGCKETGTFLILVPSGVNMDGKNPKEIFFVRETNPRMEKWLGKTLGVDGSKSILGFDSVVSSKKFPEYFQKFLAGTKVLFLTTPLPDFYNDVFTEKKYNFDQERKKYIQDKFPGIEIKQITSLVNSLRQIKSNEEIEIIQKAINATCKGYIEAIKSCEPGMYEFELQAIIEYAFKRFGCAYTGFPSIVGSGPNSTVLHYDNDCRQMQDGDVVVMDIGGEYQGYSADVTRSVPVNGKFSQPQREIYSIVLKASDEIIKAIKPGLPPNELNNIAIKVLQDELLKSGLIKDPKDARKFMPHGVSHDIGLDVHDVGSFGPLKAGQIITVEPGIYIPADMEGVDAKYKNIGIRIEDDVLVTETGYTVLSDSAPKSIDEIEKVMKKKGIGNLNVGDK